jgi:hypothetical protein
VWRAGVETLKLAAEGDAASAPLSWQAVRFFSSDTLAAGLPEAHISAMAYDPRGDILHLLFDRAQPPLLRAIHLGSAALIGDVELPAVTPAAQARSTASLAWSGLALSPDGSALYVSHASPPALWRFARRADGTLACDGVIA